MKLFRSMFMEDGTMGRYLPHAEEWELCVPGTCIYRHLDPEDPSTHNQVYSAFLSTETFGFAEWVQVEEITANDYQRLINRLAHHLHENGFVRSLEMGFDIADMELNHGKILANNRPTGTLMAVERRMSKDGVVENFKIIPKE